MAIKLRNTKGIRYYGLDIWRLRITELKFTPSQRELWPGEIIDIQIIEIHDPKPAPPSPCQEMPGHSNHC